jgi:hypothetical protein
MMGPDQEGFGPSQALWANMATDQILFFRDRSVGIGMYDDFTSFAGLVASNVGRYQSEGNNYLSYETTSCSIVNLALTPTPASVLPTSYGAIVLTPDTTDGSTVALQYGGYITAPYGCFPFSVIPGMSADLVFEARLKISAITAARGNWFIGLAGAAGVAPIATAIPITSSDVFATTLSLLGFGQLTAATTLTSLFYERASGTVAEVTSAATIAADTYIKLGFKWDGTAKTLTPWVNGVPVSAKTVSLATTAATPWPNDYMTPIVAVEEIGTAARTLTLDWWSCAQLASV